MVQVRHNGDVTPSDTAGSTPGSDPDPTHPSQPSTSVHVLSLAEHAVSAFLHAPIAIAVCEPDGTVIRVNDAMTRLLGYPAHDLVGRDLFRLVEHDRIGRAIAACASLREGSSDTVVHDTRFHTRDGRLLDVRVTTSAVRADTTTHPHVIMHLEDTTDREDLRRRLQHEASHDPLTGLGNRAYFLDELRRAVPRGRRHEQPVTVLYLDLDDFKAVNDTHGHAVGDQLLVAFARHVRASIRPEDTAARLGGDEFAVLCEDTTTGEAARVVERLTGGSWTSELARLTTPTAVGATPGAVAAAAAASVTVGAATSPDRSGRRLSAEELLHEADAAMYASKAPRTS